MSISPYSASAAHPSGLRTYLRDAAVWLFVLIPTAPRAWLYDHLLRPLLWFFFHLERRPIVITAAGPSGNRFDMWLSWQSHIVYTLGIYEPQLIRLIRAAVKPGDFCVDVGAHLGYLTLFLSQLLGDSGRIASFEPVPENFSVLKENLRINRTRNVVVHEAALSDSSGTITLSCMSQQSLSWTPSAVARSSSAGVSTVLSCNAVSLDDFLASADRMPRLIKIDVEGAELLVLRGAIKTLSSAGPLIFLEIHSWGSPASKEVLEFLEQCGYSSEIVGTRGDEAFCLAVPAGKESLIADLRKAARA